MAKRNTRSASSNNVPLNRRLKIDPMHFTSGMNTYQLLTFYAVLRDSRSRQNMSPLKYKRNRTAK